MISTAEFIELMNNAFPGYEFDVSPHLEREIKTVFIEEIWQELVAL